MNTLTEQRKLLSFRSKLITLSSLIFFVYGCSPKHYTHPEVSIKGIEKIAVLPFENFSPTPFANEIVRRSVIIEMLSKGIDVTEPGEVTLILNELDIQTLASITTPDIQQMGELLGVSAVMKGSVGAFGITDGIAVRYPEVSLHLMLLDAASGDIIWYVWHTAGGPSFWTRHFGAEGKTMDETVREVIREALNTLD
jgi:TolB-like protein